MPLGQSGGAEQLAVGAAVELSFKVEEVAEGRVDGGECLQRSAFTERPFSSPERLVGVLGPIEPVTGSTLPMVRMAAPRTSVCNAGHHARLSRRAHARWLRCPTADREPCHRLNCLCQGKWTMGSRYDRLKRSFPASS
jgi:hypothetical protein